MTHEERLIQFLNSLVGVTCGVCRCPLHVKVTRTEYCYVANGDCTEEPCRATHAVWKVARF